MLAAPSRGGRERDYAAGATLLHSWEKAFDREECRGEIPVDRRTPSFLALDVAAHGR